MPDRLPISAIVVSRNEARELDRCLPTIDFCDEIVVVDLDSDDATGEVARAHGARVLRTPAQPVVEAARLAALESVRHEWLLLTDPDEEVPEPLVQQVAAFLAGVEPDVAIAFAPIAYYARGRRLRGTIWGGERTRRFLVRRQGVEFAATIYGGARLRPGFRAVELPRLADNAIRHRWIESYGDFLRKHRRYVAVAGADRASSGEVTGWRRIARTPVTSFAESFFARRGYRDGVTGLVLSVLWAWYSTAAELALKRSLR